MIVADTGVWIDHLRDDVTPQVARFRAFVNEGTSIAVTGVGRAALADALDEHPVIPTTLVDLDAAAALHRSARDAGSTVRSSIDCLIAAPCIRLGVPLLHADADFDRIASVSELRVVAT